ncbi:hypothetical protein SAMN05216503_2095 [Polaribacter sp. KT25b]|uniref:hypothetical protein n=1 Tax=Polaribacter sp. KT25b TaxID=1855336 RepID=UPI00087CC533|nr:hypothetical protein [Polaribacter sp. KT25b]SDS13995.1 hypothetical protein SAMN05216503_2095 [Polaribacter sp. KT25b]
MKKGILILVGMFIMTTTVKAKTNYELPNKIEANYTYNNAVNFIEHGIEFFIFTNGDFDFNALENDTYYDYNGSRIKNNSRLRIDRDYRGRITRIENIFINYDYRGNVSRVGSIFMRYYRDRLTKVGDLNIRYDRFGNPAFYGNVRDYYYNNGIRFSINFGDIFDYNNAYFYRSDFSRNYNRFREDANFYYYKANPNAKIGKRSTIIKRRKPASTIGRNRDIKRNSNNSYRKPTNDKRTVVVKDTRRNTTPTIDRNIDKRNSNNSYRKPTNDKRTVIIKDTRRNTTSTIDRNTDKRNSNNSYRKPTNDKRTEVIKDTRRSTTQKLDKKTDNNSRKTETTRKRRN